MITKLKVVLVLLLVHMATCYTTCKNCAGIAFSFAINSHIYPDRDSISVGDTIWVEVDAPTRLLNLASSGSSINTVVDYSGAVNIGSTIGFSKLGKGNFSTTGVTDAAQSFKTHLVSGDSIRNDRFINSVKSFRFKEINSRYRFKAGFIALEKGDFMISPGDAAGVYRRKDKCTKAGFAITIADTDQHLYIYQESRPGYEIGLYEQTHSYFVRVK